VSHRLVQHFLSPYQKAKLSSLLEFAWRHIDEIRWSYFGGESFPTREELKIPSNGNDGWIDHKLEIQLVSLRGKWKMLVPDAPFLPGNGISASMIFDDPTSVGSHSPHMRSVSPSMSNDSPPASSDDNLRLVAQFLLFSTRRWAGPLVSMSDAVQSRCFSRGS